MKILGVKQNFGKGYHAPAAWSELLPNNTVLDVENVVYPAHVCSCAEYLDMDDDIFEWVIDPDKFIDSRDVEYHHTGPFSSPFVQIVLTLSKLSLWNVLKHYENTGENIFDWTLGTLRFITPPVVWKGMLEDVQTILDIADTREGRAMFIQYHIENYIFLLGRIAVKFIGGYTDD